MKSSLLRILSSLLIVVLLVACSLTPANTPNQPEGNSPDSSAEVNSASVPSAPVPFEAETDGPAGLAASLFSPDIVLLTRETVPVAVSYQVQIIFHGMDPWAVVFFTCKCHQFYSFHVS